jgi:methylmalonyl-CoA mutase
MQTGNKIQLPEEFHLKDDFPVPTIEEWKAKVEKDLKGHSYEKLFRKTNDGITLNPIYTQKDLKNKRIEQNIFAGSRRGETSETNWLINQEIATPDVTEFNSALKQALANGQNSIFIALDKATQKGLDADYAIPEEVGKDGLSFSELNSFGKILSGIDITKYPLVIECGFSSVQLLSLLSAYCKKEGIDIADISGVVAADPLGYLAAEGELPVPLNSALVGIKKSIEWSKKNAPFLKTCNVSTIPYAESGASSVQELAIMLATGAEYIRAFINMGLDLNIVAESFTVTLGIGNSFFTEVAKFRAAKLLWKNLITAFNNNGNKTFVGIDLHAVSLQFNKTILDPYVNMLRGTTEAFSAIAGGVKGIRTLPFNSLFSFPDDFSRRIARNTQIILKEESRFSIPVDPAGGSYFVETLTDELAKKAWKEFQKIEKTGGIIECLKNGYIHEKINLVYNKRKKEIAECKSVIVGTNKYVNPKEKMPEAETNEFNYTAFLKKRAEHLKKIRSSTDKKSNEKIIEILHRLSADWESEPIDITAEALLAGATLREISGACRSMLKGEPVKISPIKKHRLALSFEKLRLRGEKIKEKLKTKPSALLVRFGGIKEYKARVDFARGFFEVGGFEVNISDEYKSNYTEAISEIIKSKSKIIVICSSDNNYPEIIIRFAKEVKREKPQTVIVLAGNPKEKESEYKKNGVDRFIYMNADALELLSGFLNVYDENITEEN